MNAPLNGTKPARASNSGDAVLDRYEPVIGLEVHCQLKTQTKLFCGCSTAFGAMPNHNTCPVCLGHPGVLPALNSEAVNFAIRFALAVGADIQETSVFARKQYFYPDLPKGYQITQYDLPYCTGGKLTLASGKTVRLIRAHLEEDAGKNVHGDESSYVDLNRAGVPLIEIVSHADIRTPEDAADYLKRLRSLVRSLEICDGNLEEGSFRCDANVSIRPRGQEKFGTRCEIKNLNSFRNIERAIKYEILRQADLLDHGQPVVQQTMLFDAASGKTHPMRSKEESHDYRYFPEPDLLPLRIDEARIQRQRETLPELPEAMARRFEEKHGLSAYDAAVLTSDKDLAGFYEAVVKRVGSAATEKIVANWVTSEYLREVNNRNWDLTNPPITADHLGELIELIGKSVISGRIAKTLFEEMAEKGPGKGPKAMVEAQGLIQVSDTSEIRNVVTKVLDANPEQLADYLGGRDKLFGFFVGQTMKVSGGKMNPQMVNDVLKELLDARRKG
ncbi:Asp-tRNA(Asn)/Glu-tRNA(Gln) amidotransferase subunit GatB [bacterium]|nr:Asp-tRNA(Asn)/Glu-tRNA(Gln) amidotransferase subunit GatB [bacterium]